MKNVIFQISPGGPRKVWVKIIQVSGKRFFHLSLLMIYSYLLDVDIDFIFLSDVP